MESNWPKECGFFGCGLTNWDARAEHLEGHFMKGMNISQRKFSSLQRSHDTKPSILGANETEDDDQDDFHGGNAGSKSLLPLGTSGSDAKMSSQYNECPRFNNHM